MKQFYGTGRRRESVARVYIKAGRGQVHRERTAGGRIFPQRGVEQGGCRAAEVHADARSARSEGHVKGGGVGGQSGAVRMGLSRALSMLNPELRPALRKNGFLTRDSRMKERKKYGQKGARRRFQFSKR